MAMAKPARSFRLLTATQVAMLAMLLCGAASAGPARLKAGAEGPLCRKCHPAFNERLKRKFVHKPLRNGKCTGCHSPHAASHKALLKSESKEVCGTCHAVVKADAVSKHDPAVQNRCQRCHDPHASNHRGVLLSAQNELCSECHATLVKDAEEAKYKHAPLRRKGCTGCHEAHSSKEKKLLIAAEPKLCVGCHPPNRGNFQSRHVGFPVGKRPCTGCHSPHGSNRRGMLREHSHAPVAKGNCTECHVGRRAKDPFALREQGSKLCQTCHAKLVKAMQKKGQVHAAVFAPSGCLSCHTAHGSARAKLLRADMQQTCGACHADTIARFAQSPTKHSPVLNDCHKCHEPHASDNRLLLKKQNVTMLCGTCHQWRKHSSHKVGERYEDPRNPNLHLDCLSCHLAHGTEYKNMVPFPSTAALCRECHRKMAR